MKFSLIATIVILAVAAIIGGRNQVRITGARKAHHEALAEARRLGIDGLTDPGSGGPASAHARGSRMDSAARDAHARNFAARLANFALRLDAMQKEGTHDASIQREIFEMIDEMLKLDADQLKALIASLRANPDLTDEMRRNIVGFSIMMLANDHPQAALALVTGSSDLFSEKDQAGHMISNALSQWARNDPAAALAWVRENASLHPEWVTDETKRGLIGGAARQDPRLAFRLIAELGLTGLATAGDEIAGTANTSAERSAVLSALRDHLAANPHLKGADDLLTSTITSLARGAAEDGYESATAWLDSARLNEAESAAFVESLSPWQTREDTGKWISWMSGKLPPDQLAPKVEQFISHWTREDYKAAGEWLNSSPPGPAKETAVASYANTVAPYEPESAAQWALTLPPGKDRDSLLNKVHNHWQKTDPDAAAAFARKHGIIQAESGSHD